jgi:N,N-dimethylformamidase
VILGSHPEYWTRAMLAGLTAYLADGGRVMYLGGNGLYWVTSIDPERPHLIEVRKSGEGDFHPWLEPLPGELQHSTTLEAGGLWARRGFPPRRLLGVEYSSHVFHDSGGRWGFERLQSSREESHTWIFEGVDEDVVGRFGLNLGSAAGFEMDSVQERDSGDASTIALARARHEEFSPTRSVPVPPASDIALTTFRGGGLVFAAGSVTWTGSLAHNDYENSVSRITENVLGRFLGPSCAKKRRGRD